MQDGAINAQKSRIVPLPVSYNKALLLTIDFLQQKTLDCDPLPDVEQETDLNTFIT